MIDIASRREAASILAVDERSVRRYEAQGRLPKASIQSSIGGLKRAYYPRSAVLELKRVLEAEAFARRTEEQKRRDIDTALLDERAHDELAARDSAALELELVELRTKRATEDREWKATRNENERERDVRDEIARVSRQVRDDQSARARAAFESRELTTMLLASLAAVGTLGAAIWCANAQSERAIEPQGLGFKEALTLMQELVRSDGTSTTQ